MLSLLDDVLFSPLISAYVSNENPSRFSLYCDPTVSWVCLKINVVISFFLPFLPSPLCNEEGDYCI